MALRRATLALALALTSSACASGAGLRARPGTAEARGFIYADNAGLSVITAGAAVDQPVTRAITVSAHGVVDHLRIAPPALEGAPEKGGNQPTGHAPHPGDADVLSGASARLVGGAITEKTRIEGVLGATYDGSIRERPLGLSAEARVSHEPDYRSYAATVRARVELFQRNLTATGFLGVGLDEVLPTAPPPGQEGRFPASHARVSMGGTLAQILSPRAVLSFGLSLNHQRGVLESPYRRALVRTSLFPESVPGTRTRATAFVELSYDLGFRTALQLEQGIYADSWGVVGFIPQLSLRKELGDRALLTARYRFYRQAPAWFYRARYDDVAPIMSSDPRLGFAREHAPGLSLRYTPLGERGGFGALTVDASYDLSVLDYESAAFATVLGHVVSVGVVVSY